MLTTINRTAASFFAAILAAEYVLRIVPPGTHDWAKFVTPEEAQAALSTRGMAVVEKVGLFYGPLSGTWSFSDSYDVNYGIVARKLPAAPAPLR